MLYRVKTWNLDQILPLILECGGIALKYYENPVKRFKPDHSLLTEADTVIEARLEAEFDHPQDGVYLLGEETIANRTEAYLAAAMQKTAWVIDPIDGTAPYANRLPTWGVSIGLMENSVLKEGAIFLAALGELYYTDRGRVYLQKLPLEPDRWTLGKPLQLKAPDPEIPKGSMISLSQRLARFGGSRLPFYVQVTGSCVFALTKLAAGCYGAYVTRVRLWDFAAGFPMLKSLGYAIEFYSGGELASVMDERNLLLDPGHHQRWICRDHVIFAPSHEAADYLRQRISLPNE